MKSPTDESPTEEAPTEDLDVELRKAGALRRRAILKALGAVVVVGAVGSGAAAIVMARKRRSDAALAVDLAKQSGDSLDRGDLRSAKKLAGEARDLDPISEAARMAFIHASAFDVIDGDGSSADAVALLSNARKLGARGLDLAIASLAAAVGVKNDRLAEHILKEHDEQKLLPDARYSYVAGAAYDLLCDEEAIRRYTNAGDLFFAKVRRVRALLFAGRVDEAKKAIAELPKERRETEVLGALADRIASFLPNSKTEDKPRWVNPAWATELPKSLRVIATAMALGDPDAPSGQSTGLDAALDDADTPLAALVSGRIALAAGDKVSARVASACALRMREELPDAKVFAARIALCDDELGKAKDLAGEGPDKATVLMIQAIESYERGDKTRLAEIDKESQGTPERFWGMSLAKALLGEGELDKPAALDDAIARNQPWSDLFAIDAALATHDVERAKKLAAAWSDTPMTDARKLRKKHITEATAEPDKPK